MRLEEKRESCRWLLFKAAFSSETCFACLFCLDTFLFLLRVYKFLSATSLNLDLLFFDSGWLVLKKGVSSMLKGVAPKIFSRASPETPIFTRFAHNPPPPNRTLETPLFGEAAQPKLFCECQTSWLSRSAEFTISQLFNHQTVRRDKWNTDQIPKK